MEEEDPKEKTSGEKNRRVTSTGELSSTLRTLDGVTRHLRPAILTEEFVLEGIIAKFLDSGGG